MPARNATRKLIEGHLVEGTPEPGREIGLRIDQTLTQDATGTLVMLELEAMGLDRVKTEVSAQYVDHNLIQADFRNPDDHAFLLSACRRWGVWYSPPGNGVSHPLHMRHFGAPGKTLLGSDSHTCAAGSLGMLAIGAGGLEVALAMAGEPFYLRCPEVWGVELVGELPEWVSAKDVILEMLRRHDVDGGVGRVVEYFGPGLAQLAAMDRHVIANMGAELGATATVFPADEAVKLFLEQAGRGGDWRELAADPGAEYDHREVIDLSELEPLIAQPSSPGNVVAVREVAGRPIQQAYLGSSANPGLRDFAVPARMVEGRHAAPGVSFDVNPTSRDLLEELSDRGDLARLLRAGARLHQAGCNGCIGMGQAPATDGISLRTVPRNFPGRSGTREDRVYLCSPETATASAVAGRITDPRQHAERAPHFPRHRSPVAVGERAALLRPDPSATRTPLRKGPNISELSDLDPLPERLKGRVLLKLEDDVSTDEILPAGTGVLPLRSNVPAISEHAFEAVDAGFAARAKDARGHGFIVAGDNYGQGSSREHAALAPRHLGVRAVIARSFARIHWQNLANFGVLPLVFADAADWARLERDDELEIPDVRRGLEEGDDLAVRNTTRGEEYAVRHELSRRQRDAVLAGGVVAQRRLSA